MKRHFIPKKLRKNLKSLIKENEIKEALQLLDKHFDGENNDVVQLIKRWNRHRKDSRANIYNLMEETIRSNKITYDLIELISDFPESELTSSSNESLYNKIIHHPESGLWSLLEKIVVDAVVVGGTTAMGYYQEAWKSSKTISGSEKNPSTEADIEATIAILRVLDSYLNSFSKKLECKLLYFGEETTDELLEHSQDALGPQIINSIVFKQKDFFKPSSNTIRVIFDAIDGTSNFRIGFPFFCSAVAILIDNVARVSAIYDPIHHTVYSAVLKGPDVEPDRDGRTSAHQWNISTGSRKNLLEEVQRLNGKENKPRNEPVGIHLSRNPLKKHLMREFIGIETVYIFTEETYSQLRKEGIDEEIIDFLRIRFNNKNEYQFETLKTIIEKEHKKGFSETQFKTIINCSEKTSPAIYHKLENLALETGGIFALNSGILAMAEIANGSLGGFINPATNAWDVTAGEVLLKAIKGKVVNMEGESIDYSRPGPVSVVSARNKQILKHLKQVLKIS